MKASTYATWTMMPVDSTTVISTPSAFDITREFVRTIMPDVTTTFEKDYFYAKVQTKTINVTFSPDYSDALHDAFIQEHFNVSINSFLMGILHELGHIATFDEDLNHDRAILYYMLKLDFKRARYKEFTNMYFAIPSEFEATKWGVEYYLSHKEQCDNFLKEVEPAITWFKKVWGYEDEAE